MTSDVYYAIGDVHGEADKLDQLLEYITEDAERLGVKPLIVFLGDLIDRGPDSRSVVERVLKLEREAADRVRTVLGNHEEMLLNAWSSSSQNTYATWSLNGGDFALQSYERANGKRSDWRESVDADHIRWMRTLPTLIQDVDRKLAFVHAGIDPWRFPNCPDGVRVWTRSETFFRSEDWPDREELRNILVVHGHSPTDDFEPEQQPRRINVDTGVCFGGPLTCVVLAPGEEARFLRVA